MKKTKFYSWTKGFGYHWNMLGFGLALSILAGIIVLLIAAQLANWNAIL